MTRTEHLAEGVTLILGDCRDVLPQQSPLSTRAALGRRFTGIEIDETYFEIALRRVSDALARPRMFCEPTVAPKQEAFVI